MPVCSCHVTCAFESESTLYSCLNVKELLARSRREIWRWSDCNWTRLDWTSKYSSFFNNKKPASWVAHSQVFSYKLFYIVIPVCIIVPWAEEIILAISIFAKSEYRLKINDEIIMTIEVEQIKIKKKEKHLTELVINRVLVR